MANNGLIDQLISSEVEKQLADLKKGLLDTENQMKLLIEATMNLNKQIKDVSSFSELQPFLKETKANTEKLNAVDKERERLLKAKETLQAKIAQANTAEAKTVESLKQRYNENIKAVRTSIKENSANEGSITKLRIQLTRLQQDYKNLSVETRNSDFGKGLKSQIQSLNKEINSLDGAGLSKKVNLIGASFKNMLSAFGLVTGIRLFANAIKGGTNNIIVFEQANADLASILQTNRKNIVDLTKDAQRLGAATEYTASEVTGLQIELAKLGFDKLEIMNSTESILQFATATGGDLSESAALAGATLRAFNLDSSETQRVVSAMGVGTTKSALNFGFLKTAMSTVAPIAAAFNFSIEDTVALLGSLADAGFDASTAATSTKNILLNLADVNGKLAKKLGAPVRNLEDLVKGLKKLNSENVDLATTLELTDKRSVAAFQTFLKGADNITELKDSITGVSDELRKMQEERLDTVAGQTKLLSSAWEGLTLSFSSSTGVFKTIIGYLTTLVNGITDLILGADEVMKRDLDASKAFGIKDASTELNELIKSYKESPFYGDETHNEIALMSVNELIIKYEKRMTTYINELEDIAPGGNLLKGGKKQKKQVEDLKHYIKIIEGMLIGFRQQQDLINYELDNEVKSLASEAAAKAAAKATAAAKAAAGAAAGAAAAKKLANDITKVENDLVQLQLKGLADIEKAKAESNTNILSERIEAQQRYDVFTSIALQKQKEYEIAAATASISDVELRNKTIELINEKYKQQEVKNNEDSVKMLLKIQEDYQKQLTKDLKEQLEIRKAEIAQAESAELVNLAKLLKSGEITQKEHDKRVRDLKKKNAKALFNEEIDMYEALLMSAATTDEERADINKKMQKARLAAEKETNDAIVDDYDATVKEQIELERKLRDAKKKLEEEAWNFAAAVVSGYFERVIQGYDSEIESIERQRDAKLAALDEQGASEETYNELKQEIEAAADAQTQQIEERKRQAQTRQAQFEKALAIAKTTWFGIRAAVEALPNYILAGIITATTALQVATIAVQPIPKYAFGTASHPGGAAIVGDGGKRELVIEPSGKSWITDNKSTIVDLPRGTEVLPSVPDLILPQIAKNLHVRQEKTANNRSNKELIKAIKENKSVMNVSLNPRGQWKISTDKNTTLGKFNNYVNKN